MDQQNNEEEIIGELVGYWVDIQQINRNLQNGQPPEQKDIDELSDNFHVFMDGIDPSNIPDRNQRERIGRYYEMMIDELEEFLRLVDEHPDKQIGLSEERIAQFVHLEAGDDQIGKLACAACLYAIEVGEKSVRLDCGHVLSKACADKWFADVNFCPHCDQVFT